MLELRHIVRLKLDRTRLAAHQQMQPPSHAVRPLSRQFSALNDAVVSSIVGMEPTLFEMQLAAAREFGTAFIGENRLRQLVGVSSTTSVLRSGSIENKHMIVPLDLLRPSRHLQDHYIIGTFLTGSIENGMLPDFDTVEIAGWATIRDIQEHEKQLDGNSSFRTKLPVAMMPCSLLRPLDTLVEQLVPAGH